MSNQVIKLVLAGLLLGAALFWAPFLLLKVLVILLLLGLIFRLFRGRRHYSHWAFADRIRSMSDEEYLTFKSRRGFGCGYKKDSDKMDSDQNEPQS